MNTTYFPPDVQRVCTGRGLALADFATQKVNPREAQSAILAPEDLISVLAGVRSHHTEGRIRVRRGFFPAIDIRSPRAR